MFVYQALGNRARSVSTNRYAISSRFRAPRAAFHRGDYHTRRARPAPPAADAIERQLAHQESDDVRRAYMHAAEYWPERVRMMQAWADHLDELRDAGKVVPLRRENA